MSPWLGRWQRKRQSSQDIPHRPISALRIPLRTSGSCRNDGKARPSRLGQCIMRERPVFGMGGRGGSARKISERMALYLEGKTPLDANDLSPKEATE